MPGDIDSKDPTYGFDAYGTPYATDFRTEPFRPSQTPIGARHEYTYIATTLIEDLPLTDLPLRNVSFSWARNKPGTFSADLQVPVFSRSRDYLHATRPGRTAIYVFRDGIPIWGGIIWKRSMSSSERVIKLEGDTFDSYMYHRILDQSLRFARDMRESLPPDKQIPGTDQIDMFRILWAHMSGDWDAVGKVMANMPVPFRQNADIRVVLPSAPNNTIYRGRSFMHWDFPTYGSLLEALAGLKDGFEWFSTVKPMPDGITSVSGVQRSIEFGYPSLGRPFLETGFIWEYPANMLSYTWTDDADKSATRAFVIGNGEGDLKVYADQYNAQRLDEGWPMLDVSYSHTTVFRKETLLSHAAKYLRAFDPPVGEFSLTVHPDLPPTCSPAGGQNYFLGDEVGIKIDDEIWGMADVRTDDLLVVITGISVTPNDDGLENVQPEIEIKARNTYIGPEEEDGADQASEPENTIPVAGGAGGGALVQSWRERMNLRAYGGGWQGSRP